jgi:hypothetical protein
MLFPATHFRELNFSCISISLNCIETILRFKFYEFRALYHVQVFIRYINICNYCTLVIIEQMKII